MVTLAYCILLFIALGLGYLFGEHRGWKRRGQFEPQRSQEVMEMENDMVKESAKYLQLHIEVLNKTLQPAMNAVEAGMYKTMLERNILKDHVIRKFVNTCDDIAMKHRYEIRSGPYTKDQIEKLLGAVLDGVFTHNTTIADAITEIMQRVYFETPKRPVQGAFKVPITPVP